MGLIAKFEEEQGVEQTKPAPLWEKFEDWERSDFGDADKPVNERHVTDGTVDRFYCYWRKAKPHVKQEKTAAESNVTAESAMKRKAPLTEENPLPPSKRGKKDEGGQEEDSEQEDSEQEGGPVNAKRTLSAKKLADLKKRQEVDFSIFSGQSRYVAFKSVTGQETVGKSDQPLE